MTYVWPGPGPGALGAWALTLGLAREHGPESTGTRFGLDASDTKPIGIPSNTVQL